MKFDSIENYYKDILFYKAYLNFNFSFDREAFYSIPPQAIL